MKCGHLFCRKCKVELSKILHEGENYLDMYYGCVPSPVYTSCNKCGLTFWFVLLMIFMIIAVIELTFKHLMDHVAYKYLSPIVKKIFYGRSKCYQISIFIPYLIVMIIILLIPVFLIMVFSILSGVIMLIPAYIINCKSFSKFKRGWNKQEIKDQSSETLV